MLGALMFLLKRLFFRQIQLIFLTLIILNVKVNSKEINYLFPMSNSEYHLPNTDIIIKFDEQIDLLSINKNQIELSGNKSGIHNFEMILSTDKQTLILKPYNDFSLGEKVNIKLGNNIFKNDKFIELNTTFEILNKYTQNTTTNQIKNNDYITEINEVELKNSGKDFFIDYNQAKLSGELPADFPPIEVKINTNPKDGYMLVAPRVANNSGYGNYLIILDKNGLPIKYRPTTPNSFNFKQQPNGRYIVAETSGAHYGITGNGTKSIIRIFDEELNLLESFQMGNGYIAGPHEFMILPNGNYICVAQNPIPMDMSEMTEGGNPNAFIVSNVIQEFDKDKNVIFQWRAIDHIDIEESYLKLTDPVISYAHINALEVDRDGNWLISPRHTCSIMKINRGTGEIMWRLGGKKTDFTIIGDEKNGPEYFQYQHDIRRLNNGDITMFDNGNLKTPQYSRGVRYSLDEVNKTATLVWQYRNTPDVYAGQQGSVQVFEDGSYLIGWGTATAANQVGLTEIDTEGNKTFELNFPPNTSHYRVQKVAYPPCPPVADVFKEELLEGNDYDFNVNSKNTGIKITFDVLNSPVPYNRFTVKKYDCAPLNPEFLGLTPMLISHKVVIETSQITSYVGQVELDMSLYQNSLDLTSPVVFFRNTLDNGLFQSVKSTYNALTKILKFEISSDGEIAIGKGNNLTQMPIAKLTYPNDNQIVDSDDNVRLEWTNSSNFFNNQVIVYEFNENGGKTEISNENTKNLYYDLPKEKLKNNTNYSWKVTPNYLNNGNSTEEWTFTPKEKYINILSPVGGEKVSNINSKFIIRWEDNFMDSVKIELLKSDNTYKTIKDTVISYTNNFIWNVTSDIEKGTDYKVRISSFNNGVVSISPATFIIDENTSVDEIKYNVSFDIFPNPTSNKLNINIDEININNSDFGNYIKNIEIYNLQSNLIYQNKIEKYIKGNLEIDVNNFEVGSYYLIIFNDQNKTLNTSFIKK